MTDIPVEHDTPDGELQLKTIAMPSDANPSGDIFGGWVLSQMDKAAGITAGQKAQGRVATIAIDSMKFVRPVHVGDVLCVYCMIKRVGNTSITLGVDAWVIRNRYGDHEQVTEGVFTFVAIDEQGKPRKIPG